jgi:Bacterial regulatory proteins, lacI family
MHQKPAQSTIKEVVSATGVSAQIVSNIIYNKPSLFLEARKGVQDIVEELSCQPVVLAGDLTIRQDAVPGNGRESIYSQPAKGSVEEASKIVRTTAGKLIKICELGWYGRDSFLARSILLPPTPVLRKSSTCLKDKEGGE